MKSALQTLIERGSPREILENCGEYDLKILIVPAGHKPLFKMCAEILAALPDEAFAPIAAESARWLQDLNWPGRDAIESRLRRLPKEKLRAALQTARQTAQAERDEEWLFNLNEVFLND